MSVETFFWLIFKRYLRTFHKARSQNVYNTLTKTEKNLLMCIKCAQVFANRFYWEEIWYVWSICKLFYIVSRDKTRVFCFLLCLSKV